ncbi:MAG: TIGR00289 family protein [Candidatus Aenigmarchaeota archaeon]|nr:TIGR00289 family protein [Candidatus Aenigmarchaeota archaeon]
MKLASLISSGKDSLYAMYLASRENEIKYIISFISENPDSYMFHVPNAKLVGEQAKAMGIPLIQAASKGQKEKELDDISAALKKIKNEIDGVTTGAVASNYQKSRIDKICDELGLRSIVPLWHSDQAALLGKMLEDDFEIIIVAVAAQGLGEEWLGKKIDAATLPALVELSRKHRFSIIGEGGEFETFVLDCPMFKKKIKIIDSEKIWDAKTRSGILQIKKIEMVNKS